MPPQTRTSLCSSAICSRLSKRRCRRASLVSVMVKLSGPVPRTDSRIRLAVPALRILESVLGTGPRSEEHTSELQSLAYLVCRLLLEKKKTTQLRSLTYLLCSLLLAKKTRTNSALLDQTRDPHARHAREPAGLFTFYTASRNDACAV